MPARIFLEPRPLRPSPIDALNAERVYAAVTRVDLGGEELFRAEGRL
jgi:hypothetical protein